MRFSVPALTFAAIQYDSMFIFSQMKSEWICVGYLKKRDLCVWYVMENVSYIVGVEYDRAWIT